MEHNFDNSDKWWLISDEAVTFIKAALAAPTHAANCYNCQDGLLEACCPGCDGDDMREAASYILDNSLRPAPDPEEVRIGALEKGLEQLRDNEMDEKSPTLAELVTTRLHEMIIELADDIAGNNLGLDLTDDEMAGVPLQLFGAEQAMRSAFLRFCA